MALFRASGYSSVTLLDRTANARSKAPGTHVAIIQVQKSPCAASSASDQC